MLIINHIPTLAHGENFSVSQTQPLTLLEYGRSINDISRVLNTVANTIKVHLVRIYRTLGVRNRVKALAGAGFGDLVVLTQSLIL